MLLVKAAARSSSSTTCRLLGVTEDAGFEEVLQARNFLYQVSAMPVSTFMCLAVPLLDTPPAIMAHRSTGGTSQAESQ
jgi:hypothetical protein